MFSSRMLRVLSLIGAQALNRCLTTAAISDVIENKPVGRLPALGYVICTDTHTVTELRLDKSLSSDRVGSGWCIHELERKGDTAAVSATRALSLDPDGQKVKRSSLLFPDAPQEFALAVPSTRAVPARCPQGLLPRLL